MLDPPQTDELYFVADGRAATSSPSTLDEHQKNVDHWRAIEHQAAAPGPRGPEAEMALSGMTGFGRADGAHGAWTWTVEARSVNGRSLEPRFRGPPGFDSWSGPRATPPRPASSAASSPSACRPSASTPPARCGST